MIRQVGIIGLGALGILYGAHISKHLDHANLYIIADEKRQLRYKTEGVYCNGDLCDFNYVSPYTKGLTLDLVIIAVKYGQLQEAIETIKPFVGEDTLIMPILNGIVSEEEVAKVYGWEHVVYCVGQGMDAVREGNKLTFKNQGIICFGDGGRMASKEGVQRIEQFFKTIDLAYEVHPQMLRHLWSKFMVNVGINQVMAYYRGTYKTLQEEGAPRKMMHDAMREVILLSKAEGIDLTEEDIHYWDAVVDQLNSEGMPSMRQDQLAKRHSEVALFSGTVIQLAEKHGIDVPINRILFEAINGYEATFD